MGGSYLGGKPQRERVTYQKSDKINGRVKMEEAPNNTQE